MQELLSAGANTATLVDILIGVVSTIVVAFAGFQCATATGDSQKVGLAKNSFIGPFIGLIIASLAFIGPRWSPTWSLSRWAEWRWRPRPG